MYVELFLLETCKKYSADRNWQYSQREEELLSSWWREYAECSEGPRGQRCTTSKSSEKHSSESLKSCQLFTTDVERVGVPVKGGLYEVGLSSVGRLSVHGLFVNQCCLGVFLLLTLILTVLFA